MSRPEKISGPPPVYTEMARRARVTGVVIVEADIDEQGNVTQTKVLKGLPMGLDRAAVDAVQAWKFKPAMLAGQPVPVYYILTVNFQVDDSPALGPRLQELLSKNHELAELVETGRYAEAASLLDHWEPERPADGDVALIRVYLLLEQGQLDDAWKAAQSDRGADPYEMLCLVGTYALREAATSREVSRRERTAIVDLGLRAETMALAAKPDGVEALSTKVSLLEMMARMSSDPEERQQLLLEKNQLQERLSALRSQG